MLRNCLDMAAWDGSSRHPRVTRERRANIEHSKGARVVCNLRRSVNVLEQVRVLNAKALRDLDEVLYRGIAFARLNFVEICAVNADALGEVGLRPALLLANLTDPLAQAGDDQICARLSAHT